MEKPPSFLRPPEVFILLSVIALLALIWVVASAELNQQRRDAQRQSDIEAFYQAAESFKGDYGFYPNYSLVLGLNPNDGSKQNSYDLSSVIALCHNRAEFAVTDDLETPEENLDEAYLKPGFAAVSQFLNCLGYLPAISQDPLWAGTVSDYHYQVSYDYQKIIVRSSSETGSPLLLGSGGDKNVADNNDETGGYLAFANRQAANSSYLYQCLEDADGRELSVSQRSAADYAPFIQGDGSEWLPNPACRDRQESLLVVSSR